MDGPASTSWGRAKVGWCTPWLRPAFVGSQLWGMALERFVPKFLPLSSRHGNSVQTPKTVGIVSWEDACKVSETVRGLREAFTKYRFY